MGAIRRAGQWASALLALGVLAGLVAGCASSPLSPQSDMAPRDKQVIHYQLVTGSTDIAGLDPNLSFNNLRETSQSAHAGSLLPISLVFSGLVTLDKNLLPENWDAQKIDVSPDGLKYTFHLRPYRQRVGLAQALVHDPPVLVLDEPTIGLDPRQIHEIRELIRGLAGERTIVLSTHILPEVSQICDKVVIINDGLVVLEEKISEIPEGTPLEEVFLHAIAKEGHVEGASAEETLEEIGAGRSDPA